MVSLHGGKCRPWGPTCFPDSESGSLRSSNLRFLHLTSHNVSSSLSLRSVGVRRILSPLVSVAPASLTDHASGSSGENGTATITVEQAANIRWHESSIGKPERQQLLQQKGCVIWITGLSGSGKSTLACAVAQALHARGKLTYILDGDNVRHGLNKDLTFKAEDRVENIRRVGEVAKLFADAGIICIASLISPYCKDRDACRALLAEGDFIEVFMDVPLHVCEARDPKGLYKLARAGKIKGFTGIDDPYEPPMNCEIALKMAGESCPSPLDMAETVISFLEEKGYLQA